MNECVPISKAKHKKSRVGLSTCLYLSLLLPPSLLQVSSFMQPLILCSLMMHDNRVTIKMRCCTVSHAHSFSHTHTHAHTHTYAHAHTQGYYQSRCRHRLQTHRSAHTSHTNVHTIQQTKHTHTHTLFLPFVVQR